MTFSPTAPTHTDETSDKAAPIAAAEKTGLAVILICGLLLRLPFLPRGRDLGDPLNYAIGALYTHVAHPPGSIGYCLLLGWVNILVGDIRTTMVLTGLTAAMLASVLCYFAARAVGLRGIAALLATALYCFSINTLHASLTGTPHILEGTMSLALGLFAFQAVRRRSNMYLLIASAIFATGGALRPTSCALLLPLWIYTMWKSAPGSSRQRLSAWGLNLLIAAPIIAAWSWGNNHYMTLNGYGGENYRDQVLSSSQYDYDNFSGTAVGAKAVSRPSFHMPAAELLAWVELKTGIRLMPHVPDWPVPSLKRAVRLLTMQAVKQTWWILFSLPAVLLLPVFFLWTPRRLVAPPAPVVKFLLIWILPGVIFFVIGHLGTLAYIQVYLGALCILVVYLLVGTESPATTGDQGRRSLPRSPRRSGALIAVGCVIAGSALFYATARPLSGTSGIRRTLDVIALQFDGYARRNAYSTSRAMDIVSPAQNGAAQDPYLAAKTDAQLLEAARLNHFQYAIFPPQDSHPARDKP